MSTQAILPFLRALGAAPPPGLPAAPAPTPDPSANFSAQDVATGIPEGAQTGAPQPPPETKGHKLLRILQGGLVGGLNGIANDAQIYAQTGRNAGFGGGFLGATQIPLQQAMQQQQLQQSQAQTELLKQQGQMIQTPGGPMPLGLAKVFYPALIKSQTATTVQQMKGDTAETVAGINHRFLPIKDVGVYDAQAGQVLPGTSNGMQITPEFAQEHNLPQDSVGKFMALSDITALQKVQAQYAKTVKTSTDPLGMTTTSTSQKQPPAAASAAPVGATPSATGVNPPAKTKPKANNAGVGTIDSMAQDLVEGRMDPSQLPRRSAAYMTVLQKANDYSQQKYNKPFDIAQASTDYKYANEPSTQNTLKYLNSLTGADNKSGNLSKLVQMSDSIPRTDYPPINDIQAWARIKSGSGPQAAYGATITEVADQVAKILQGGGTGSGTSDAKLRQASDLFAKGFNTDQIREVASTLRDLLGNRKTELIGDNRYLLKQFGGGFKPGGSGQIHPAAQQYLNQLNGNPATSNQRP